MRKIYLYFLICFSLIFCLGLFCYAKDTKKPIKNGWKKNITQECKTITTSCSKKITKQNNTDETKSCISCCGKINIIDISEQCFNFCICECSLKAQSKSSNTRKLCSNKPRAIP